MPEYVIIKTLPAPVGGWDTRSALADMPEQNAVIMDNWFPGTDSIELRRGSATHATGLPATVQSLIAYTATTGVGSLFAASSTAIYNVTAAGAVGAADVSALTNARFQYVQIGTSGGNFILIMNGADTPRTYDGSAWATTTITGPTVANLIWCNLHQRRLWIGEEDSLSAWYLAVNAIGGAATEFPIAAIARLGGYLVGMWTWTQDAGNGSDDVAVFLTSEGEVIIYAGTDPAAAATWSLIGVFRTGKPIGRRCAVKMGSDLIVMTQSGAISIRAVMTKGTEKTDAYAITAQINPEFNAAARAGASLFGWEAFVYPLGTMLIFNIPQSASVFYQYVLNTITGAPCRFKEWDAYCWGLLEGNAYFGAAGGIVMKADTGTSDNGAAIEADVVPAFNRMGTLAKKAAKLAEVVFSSDNNPNAALDLNMDYVLSAPTGAPLASSASGALWGYGLWGVSIWGTASLIYKDWRGIRGIGRALSLRIRVSSASARPKIISYSLSFLKVAGL